MSCDERRDRLGRKIMPGDLLRSPHFTDRKGRRKWWLYHTVVKRAGQLWAVPTCHLEPTMNNGGGDCPVEWLKQAEIIDGHYLGSCWRDRPKTPTTPEAAKEKP